MGFLDVNIEGLERFINDTSEVVERNFSIDNCTKFTVDNQGGVMVEIKTSGVTVKVYAMTEKEFIPHHLGAYNIKGKIILQPNSVVEVYTETIK